MDLEPDFVARGPGNNDAEHGRAEFIWDPATAVGQLLCSFAQGEKRLLWIQTETGYKLMAKELVNQE